VARVSAFQSFITRPHSLFSFLDLRVCIHLCPYTYMKDVAKNVANIEMSVSTDISSKLDLNELYAEQVNSEDAIRAYKAVVR